MVILFLFAIFLPFLFLISSFDPYRFTTSIQFDGFECERTHTPYKLWNQMDAMSEHTIQYRDMKMKLQPKDNEAYTLHTMSIEQWTVNTPIVQWTKQ